MTNTKHPFAKLTVAASLATIAFAGLLAPSSASAATLNASSGGTFTFDFDKTALGQYVFGDVLGNNGFYLSRFYDTAASDYTNPINSDDYLVTNSGTTEVSALNLVHDLTPVGADPTGQALHRHVKGTTAGFAIDSDKHQAEQAGILQIIFRSMPLFTTWPI